MVIAPTLDGEPPQNPSSSCNLERFSNSNLGIMTNERVIFEPSTVVVAPEKRVAGGK